MNTFYYKTAAFYDAIEKNINDAFLDILETNLPDEIFKLKIVLPYIRYCNQHKLAKELINTWCWIIGKTNWYL